jgi:hypothetical protein
MSDIKLYQSNDGLVHTTLHGMDQDAFVVTEEKVSSFNSYSFEFQAALALTSTAFGAVLGNTTNTRSNIFIISTVLTIVFLVFTIWSWIKFSKSRKSLFVKAPTSSTPNDPLGILEVAQSESGTGESTS